MCIRDRVHDEREDRERRAVVAPAVPVEAVDAGRVAVDADDERARACREARELPGIGSEIPHHSGAPTFESSFDELRLEADVRFVVSPERTVGIPEARVLTWPETFDRRAQGSDQPDEGVVAHRRSARGGSPEVLASVCRGLHPGMDREVHEEPGPIADPAWQRTDREIERKAVDVVSPQAEQSRVD